MNDSFLLQAGLHWAAVLLYVLATLGSALGVFFGKRRAEQVGFAFAFAGLAIHGGALAYRWYVSGHGPYMARFEVLSSNAWVGMLLFLVFARLYPRIRAAAVIVFPSTFLVIALAMFLNPEIRKLPPSLRSIWLVLHVGFYKISAGTLLIALALSFLTIARKRSRAAWLQRLPEANVLDVHAYRFAGFGFVFWAIAMLAGSIWAHESWGRFWGWDPIETWSLVTFALFGIYLHLRRFFGWKGERAAWAFIVCFLVAMASLYGVPFMETSVHSEYFR